MTTYTWANPVSGDWNTGTLWTPGIVPNIGTLAPAPVDVVIDATATGTPYLVTIGTTESFTINSLTINDTTASSTGANSNPYDAAELVLDGTLAFAAGSAGILGNSAAGGSLQTYIFTDSGDSASIVNAGTVDGFIQSAGTLTMTGTNAVYITNDIQALGGTVVIDTPIAEITGTTLFDGIFQAVGPGPATVDLGGAGNTVDIATIEGPPLNPPGWTELTFNGPDTQINEWNGTAYVSVETTLTEIRAGGTVDVLTGRNYTTTNTLTVDSLGGSTSGGGLLNLQAGTVTTAELIITGGVVQGAATIVGAVANNGTLIAEGGTLTLTGALTGTGVVDFDIDTQKGTTAVAGATLAVNSVAAGQVFTMNGDDTLVLNTPASFAGTIAAKVGDAITLTGVTATSASISNNTLVVMNGAQTVASLALQGNYSNDHVTLSGSTVTFAAGAPSAPATEVPNDFNGDGKSDILWQNSSGTVVEWQMNGSVPTAQATVGGGGGYTIAGTGDFNGDGKADLLWASPSGAVVEWQMNGSVPTAQAAIGGGGGWSVAGTGDFNGDGKTDILWQNLSGSVVEWQMNGFQSSTMAFIGGDANWKVIGTGDFNGDGKSDILWKNSSGTVALWTMNGTQNTGSAILGGDSNWAIAATGDFNGDGKTDILWQDQAGDVSMWTMNGSQVVSSKVISGPSTWKVIGTGDYTGNGKSDILWRDSSTGSVAMWTMNGSQVVSSAVIGGDSNWKPVTV
jgi:hypothetical protein